MPHRHLAEAWLRTTGRLGARGDVAGAGARLLARWAEPHRRYHDVAHLDEVLRQVDALAGSAAEPDAVALAAWWHDAVYVPERADNEERSADLAREECRRLRLADDVVDEVARLVLMTAGHSPPEGDGDGAVLCDADLSVLAWPPERYDDYARRVREEYAAVPDDAFRAGRARVLAELLDRPALYRTAEGGTWEAAARANLRRELDGLRAPPAPPYP